MESSATAHPRKNLVLAAMIFAVSMTFIEVKDWKPNSEAKRGLTVR